MHKFIVNVNGTSYEVEVEEIDSAAAGKKIMYVHGFLSSAQSGT